MDVGNPDRYRADLPYQQGSVGGFVSPSVTTPPLPRGGAAGRILPPQGGSALAPVRYEYKSVAVANSIGAGVLNQMYGEGWEPHATACLPDGTLLVTLRRKKS